MDATATEIRSPADSSAKRSSPTKPPNLLHKLKLAILRPAPHGGSTLKVRVSKAAEVPVKSAWDSRYPVNKVLDGALLPGGKATAMGFGPAMAAIKTYSLWNSLLAHMVENSFRQAVEEVTKSNVEVKRLTDELQNARKKAEDLLADVRKYEANKVSLERKVGRYFKQIKELSAKVKDLEEGLDKTNGEHLVTRTALEKARAVAMPELVQLQKLRAELEEAKLKCVGHFDSCFSTALAQIQALHPGIDTFGMDLDKVVIAGQLVDPPTEKDHV